jgi:SAM-dependent methyltransferase
MRESFSRRRKRWRRYLDNAAVDLKLFVTGQRDPELPPHRYRQIGPGDFRERGTELAELLVRNGLHPDHRVLDIGCGIGRVALGLTHVLSSTGSYEGFDADGRAIGWCTRNFTPRHPRFRFTHADIATARNNPRGVSAAQYRFPWPDATFDFAFATSVLTHLEMDAAKRYVAEAGRVLRPGGILLVTVFLDDGRPSKLAFPIDRGDHRLMDGRSGGNGVAFLESSLGKLMPEEQWMNVSVQRGSWQTGGTFSVLTQDVLTARRR